MSHVIVQSSPDIAVTVTGHDEIEVNLQTGLPGADGPSIELQKSQTHVQWRVAGTGGWTDLVALADLKGADGQDGQDGNDAAVNFNLFGNSFSLVPPAFDGDYASLQFVSVSDELSQLTFFANSEEGFGVAHGSLSFVVNNTVAAWDNGTQRFGLTATGWTIQDVPGLRGALGLGSAALSASSAFAAAGHTHTAGQISDSTSAGRALLTAQNVTAQRGELGVGPSIEPLNVLPFGFWLTPTFVNMNTASQPGTRIWATPIRMPFDWEFTQIAEQILNSSAPGGTLITLAIASNVVSDGLNYPNQVLRSGTIEISTNGVKSVAFSPLAVKAGELYWLVTHHPQHSYQHRAFHELWGSAMTPFVNANYDSSQMQTGLWVGSSSLPTDLSQFIGNWNCGRLAPLLAIK